MHNHPVEHRFFCPKKGIGIAVFTILFVWIRVYLKQYLKQSDKWHILTWIGTKDMTR